MATTPSSPAAALEGLSDFPEWLDPMVVKELRQGLRARWFVAPFLLLQALACFVTWLEFASHTTYDHLLPSTPLTITWHGLLFWGLVFIVVSLALPLRALFAWNEEFKNNTAQLLLLAGVTRWRIIIGKWLTQICLSTLTLLSLLPYAVVRFHFGGAEWWDTAMALLGTLGFASIMNGVFLGAASFASGWGRFLALGTGLLYVGLFSCLHVLSFLTKGLWKSNIVLFYPWQLVGLGFTTVYLTLCGLKLASTQLPLSQRPDQIHSNYVALFHFWIGPFIVGIIAALTCSFGLPVAAGIMTAWISKLDPR